MEDKGVEDAVMKCLNCGKEMKVNHKVQSFLASDFRKWEGFSDDSCHYCWNCGTVYINDTWYLPEKEMASENQIKTAQEMSLRCNTPLPFPNRRLIQKFIKDNEREYILRVNNKI